MVDRPLDLSLVQGVMIGPPARPRPEGGLLDLAFWRMGEVFLKRWPLFVSLMESVFIALLCYHDTGLDSPFRWYYLLSLICCAIRYRPAVAWLTFGFHCLSLLSLACGAGRRPRAESGRAA